MNFSHMRMSVGFGLLLLSAACHQSTPPADSKAAAVKTEAPVGLTLTAEQIEKLGVTTQPLQVLDYSAETEGYGTVMTHETVALAVAEQQTAEAAERQSTAALARSRRLAGTAGAISADILEGNARQAAVDAAASALAKRRLSSIVGQSPPWNGDEQTSTLKALADGTIKLLRVTFPLGSVPAPTPKTLRAEPIGANSSVKSWKINSVWPAPADAALPGRSFFALLRASDAAEGERLLTWAPTGAIQSGILIPAVAGVISEGKYWCYIEKEPGRFVKTEFDAAKPVDAGYFVTKGVAAGDKVVIAGAGQLLAQESNSDPGSE